MEKVNGKKGFTVLELSIVLAIVAIVSASVATFSVMFAKRVNSNNKKLSLMQDVVKAQSLIDSWVNEIYTLNGEIVVLDGQLVANVSGENYQLYLSNGMLVGKIPTGERSVELSIVSQIDFSVKEKSGDKLYYCNLSYTFEKDSDQFKNYVFTVSPRVGDVILLSAEGN